MCSAPHGRKKRPRSAGSVFPTGKVAQTEPERRESAEGAVEGSRMASTEISPLCSRLAKMLRFKAHTDPHRRTGAFYKNIFFFN